MKIAVIGLGRMGSAVVHRLLNAGYCVVGYDPQAVSLSGIEHHLFSMVPTIKDFPSDCDVFWLMVPAGDVVDAVLDQLSVVLKKNDIVVDGGNSFYKDSVKRAQKLAMQDIFLLDCGTSGGLAGKDLGFSLMIGGQYQAYERIEKLFQAIAFQQGYAHVGPSGAGHYVKMVHNGIEYALLQSYAEGFDIIKHGAYQDLDLAKIATVWQHGSIIRSWILHLTEQILLRDQEFTHISGYIGESGTGAWTVQEAQEHQVAAQLIKKSLEIRKQSREGCESYATKLVALLRQEFGGHAIKKSEG